MIPIYTREDEREKKNYYTQSFLFLDLFGKPRKAQITNSNNENVYKFAGAVSVFGFADVIRVQKPLKSSNCDAEI